jgi:hypothetical protein
MMSKIYNLVFTAIGHHNNQCLYTHTWHLDLCKCKYGGVVFLFLSFFFFLSVDFHISICIFLKIRFSFSMCLNFPI